MTPSEKNELAKKLLAIPALVLVAAVILLIAFSSMRFEYDNQREDHLFGTFSCAMMALCVSCIVCGSVSKHFTNVGSAPDWVARLATAEMMAGGLLLPAAVVFGVMWLG